MTKVCYIFLTYAITPKELRTCHIYPVWLKGAIESKKATVRAKYETPVGEQRVNRDPRKPGCKNYRFPGSCRAQTPSRESAHGRRPQTISSMERCATGRVNLSSRRVEKPREISGHGFPVENGSRACTARRERGWTEERAPSCEGVEGGKTVG